MKKYIVFALIALFATVLFIACDNNVKVDNSVAFTQRIASEGAFVVNGKSYDSLQAAINAATGAKMPAPDPVKITLTKDYAGRAVSIPEDAQVAIDLNGHTLTFVDLKETTPALSVEEGAYFALGNGTVTILDKTEGLTLIAADDAYYVVLASVNADLADGQNAIAAIDTHVYLVQNEDADPTCVSGNIFLFGSDDNKASLLTFEDTVVLGSVTAVGTNAAGDVPATSDVALIVANTLPDVRMTNALLDVVSTAHVTLNALAGTNKFVATPGSSSITNNSGVDIEVINGLYSIARSGVSSYYGSLQEALDSLDEDDLVIVLRDDDESEAPVVASNGWSFTIDLAGYDISAFSISADADLTIMNSVAPNALIPPTFAGSIYSEGAVLVNCTVGEPLPAAAKLRIGGTVTSDGFGAYEAELVGNIVSTDVVIAHYCKFDNYPSITADSDVTITNSSLYVGDITSAGAVTIHYSDIYSTSPISANGYVKVTDVHGTIGNITASGVDDDGYAIKLVTDNYYGMTVGNLNAGSYDIYIDAYDDEPVTVNGIVNAGKVVADYAEFGDDIFAITAVTLSNSTVGDGSGDGVFAPVIAISYSTLNVNYLQGTEAGAPATSVSVTASTGTIGTIVASNSTATTPVITLSTPQTDDDIETTLTVTQLNAGTGEISISGNSYYDDPHTYYDYVIIDGAVTCETLSANIVSFGFESSVNAGEITGGVYYGYTTLVGNRDSVVSSGYFNGQFAYDGTGTLTVTGGSFNVTSYFNSGSVILDGSAFFNDIDALTADVVIKSATIYEYEFSDVIELVHRIDQDSATQSVTIEYLPEEIEFLTSGVFDMTSVNIEGSASLYFAMYAPSTIIGGLIVGSPDSLAASVSFNFDNGYGKKQLAVSGIIGLLVEDGSGQSGDHNVILSTQQHGGLVTKCTYSGTTSYTYTLATGPGSTASPEPIPYPGYYEYSF